MTKFVISGYKFNLNRYHFIVKTAVSCVLKMTGKLDGIMVT